MAAMKLAKILVVEDESSIVDNISVALTQEGYLLDVAKTAGEGLQKAKTNSHQLFIFDVGLPDFSGFELCKQVQKISQTPILFLTARNEEVDKIVGFELGADDYLTKPFSPRELVARIKAILKRTERSKEESVVKSFGPFQMDSERFQISFFGQVLDLSRYEFRILELLIRRPGIVYSRQQLMERVWEDPSMSMERTVDAHIKSIRAQLKSIKPEIQMIETHRGLGYSLKEL